MKALFRNPFCFISISCLFLDIKQTRGQDEPINHTLIDSNAVPQVFAPGVISTPYSEWSLSLTPDGKTAYSSQGIFTGP